MSRQKSDLPVLITGGAGFIGSNLANRLMRDGHRVVIFDNLSRAGSERNLDWLCREHPGAFEFHEADIRNSSAIRLAIRGAVQVFHFAAQVAVTTSLTDAAHDFEVNARGTLNLLEEIRRLPNPPSLVFTSTNKVYGDLRDVELLTNGTRYEPTDPMTKYDGVSEKRPLEFHSPYGCSKGSADQYVLDYARSFRLPATVFRMSCIYGPHQFGNEDQGWIAHFLIRALEGTPITLYGDGLQVRDILFIDDLLDALQLAQDRMGKVAGEAFNIGGGPKNAISLRELLTLIRELGVGAMPVRNEDWRTGDQRYYVSDTRKFASKTGWQPKVNAAAGVRRLFEWLVESRCKTASATERSAV